MFYYTIWLDHIEKVNNKYSTNFITVHDAILSLRDQYWFEEELQTLVDIKLENLCKTTRWITIAEDAEIELYGCYSADEIHLLLEDKPGRQQVMGAQYNKEKKFAMIFITINKSDKDYSPSTLYEDYAISQSQFHWQSMNKTLILSTEGQRIINQPNNGWKFILFVRDSKKDEYDFTNGYFCLGEMDFCSNHGECPMNMVWNMHNPIPAFILESAKAL